MVSTAWPPMRLLCCSLRALVRSSAACLLGFVCASVFLVFGFRTPFKRVFVCKDLSLPLSHLSGFKKDSFSSLRCQMVFFPPFRSTASWVCASDVSLRARSLEVLVFDLVRPRLVSGLGCPSQGAHSLMRVESTVSCGAQLSFCEWAQLAFLLQQPLLALLAPHVERHLHHPTELCALGRFARVDDGFVALRWLCAADLV